MADEFSDLFGEFGVQADGEPTRLVVRTFQGEGAYGPVLAPERTLEGLPIFAANRITRNSDGDEALATVAIYAPHNLAAALVPRSQVTLPDGRTLAVLSHAAPSVQSLFEFVTVNAGEVAR